MTSTWIYHYWISYPSSYLVIYSKHLVKSWAKSAVDCTTSNEYVTNFVNGGRFDLPYKWSSCSGQTQSWKMGKRNIFCTICKEQRNSNSPLQKGEGSGASFLYWLDWKSKQQNWNVNEWIATQPSLRVFCGKLSKWEPCKSCKIPYKPL